MSTPSTPLDGGTAASGVPAAGPASPDAATTTTSAHAGVPAPTPQSPATAGSLGGAVFALVLVVGLILLLSWLARRVPGLGGSTGGANPALRIVGSLALGPRDRLVVVDVGGTQLLLGVGAGGTRTLHALDAPLPTPAAKSTPAFAQLLAQHFGKKP
jgi:flagellar protein FliO/FliZ